MSILYSKESLLAEEKMLHRMRNLVADLLAINLERQLRIAEADIETGEGNGAD